MTVYQIYCREHYADGSVNTEYCECYTHERDAACICLKYNQDKDSNVEWHYDPISLYEETEIDFPVGEMEGVWCVEFNKNNLCRIDWLSFAVNSASPWEILFDNHDKKDRKVTMKIRVNETDADAVVSIAKKMYAEYMEVNK